MPVLAKRAGDITPAGMERGLRAVTIMHQLAGPSARVH
jgi:hypothetical protein